MPKYRRPNIQHLPIFFTVCLANRGSSALLDHIDLLRDSVRRTKEGRPFDVLAWVVLPDHMHCVWKLPETDSNYSQRWGQIKARFTRDLRRRLQFRNPGHGSDNDLFPRELPTVRTGRFSGLKPGLRRDKREAAVWQRRFWEHHCRNEADLQRHIRYCWLNPVKHGFVEKPTDWVASSIHRDIRLGRVEAEWSGVAPVGEFGEVA
ncbi:transposase [Rhodobacteraceae bacterium M385]|nr:transposase [Rhodobacteraceae bacterium M385]